ncbi:MAG TPA: hypothetical protein VGT08_15260 [Terracidiphilus sp.]|nr:hypothetical protein [Terracidiphilus sp.]
MVRAGDGSPQPRWALRDWLAAAGLFLATAGVILWQNAHLAILWDLSYVLDTATRIALGQMPYRDFPFAHAPLTFLIQAAIIGFTGRVFFHHVLYAAVVGGLGTMLTWRIALHSLRGRVAAAWTVSLLLAAPLTVLGIYCVMPLPSYDCDCAFAILAAVWLLQRLAPEDVGSSARGKARDLVWGLVTGAALCVPLFFKQNIGLPFLASAGGIILLALAMAFIGRANPAPRNPWTRTLLAVLAGVATTLSAAVLLLHFTVGIGNYIHWTIGFAAQRRLPGFNDMLAVYHDSNLLWTLPCVALALLLLRSSLAKMRWAQFVAVALLAAPFVYTLCSLFIYDDADERGDTLLALWPLLLILSAVLAVYNMFRHRRDLNPRTLLPFVLLVAINGAFMSQQLWGSTYAIWPLLIIFIAEMIVFLAEIKVPVGAFGETPLQAVEAGLHSSEEPVRHAAGAKAHVFFMPFSARLKSCPDTKLSNASGRVNVFAASSSTALVIAALISATLLICGGFYTASEERLSYAQLPEGQVQHSTFPQLAGMAIPGPYLPDFEELLGFAAANIPSSDGLILIPGEDPFYFVTGRIPQFPVLLFDPATDPYSPAEIASLVRSRNIHWLIVKRELQIKKDPTPQREVTLKALMSEFTLAARLHGYDVYQRQ